MNIKEITFSFNDEFYEDRKNLTRLLNVGKLENEIHEFEMYLRKLYKYGEFEADETLSMLEDIRNKFYETIGSALVD